MDAFAYTRQALSRRGIELCGALPFSLCLPKYPHRLSHTGFESLEGLSVIIFAVPYLSRDAFYADRRNISLYAVSRDYHIYFDELWSELSPALHDAFAGYKFTLFADASPIDEVHAAACAGLGVIGDNRLLITEKYSSFVFIGEIVTDYPIVSHTTVNAASCEMCGRCRSVCPAPNQCLSALTQKKGQLTDLEADIISTHSSAWGCDMCQLCCPHTKRAIKDGSIFTSIDFFRNSLLPIASLDSIELMDDAEFAQRAYSWRGRNVISRNLKILENTPKKEDGIC